MQISHNRSALKCTYDGPNLDCTTALRGCDGDDDVRQRKSWIDQVARATAQIDEIGVWLHTWTIIIIAVATIAGCCVDQDVVLRHPNNEPNMGIKPV